MKMKGDEALNSVIDEWKKIIDQSKNIPEVVYDQSVRMASPGTIAKERGSLVDRLANTNEEAETISRAEAVRRQEPTEESSELTQEQLDKIDNDVVMRLVDEFVYKTILQGK